MLSLNRLAYSFNPKKVRDRIMQITIRGHHLTITPAIEENIRKICQMTKHLDQVNSMQVKLTKDHQLINVLKKAVLIILLKRLFVYRD
jgi:DNA-directed RNA polymerase subunit L